MNQLQLIANFLSGTIANFFSTLSASWFGVALISLIILDVAVSVLIILRGTK